MQRNPRARAPQSSGVLRAEPQRPEADGFVRDLNPSGQHQLGDVTPAHTEAVVEPHATTDDLRREAIAFLERWSGRWLGHDGIRADRKRLDNASSGNSITAHLPVYLALVNRALRHPASLRVTPDRSTRPGVSRGSTTDPAGRGYHT